MKQTIQKGLLYGGIFLFSAVGSFLLVRYLSGIDWLLLPIFLILSLFLLINIHEFGHLLFGKMAGYELMAYKIGPLTWRYENGRFRFLFEPIKGFAGYCMMKPPGESVPKSKNLLFYGGGVLLNLTTGLLALIVAICIPQTPHWLLIFLYPFAFLSLLVGGMNLCAFETGNNPTDGMIIWSLIRNNAFAHSFIHINQLMTEITVGKRPRDIEALRRDEQEIRKEQPFQMTLALYSLYNAIDSGERDRIEFIYSFMRQNSALIPTALEAPMKYELCFTACLLGQRERAIQYYEAAKKSLLKDNDLNGNRIKAYYAWYIEQDRERALLLCDKALRVADSFPLIGQRLMEIDLIKELQEVINSQTNGQIQQTDAN